MRVLSFAAICIIMLYMADIYFCDGTYFDAGIQFAQHIGDHF